MGFHHAYGSNRQVYFLIPKPQTLNPNGARVQIPRADPSWLCVDESPCGFAKQKGPLGTQGVYMGVIESPDRVYGLALSSMAF